jgi:capsular exopolysaccharide synthesis family protein
VQPARPPTAAASPKIPRNVAIGVVLGVILGLLLAVLFDRLDRRLRDPREVEELFERPILGAIPESRALARRGADESALPAVDAEAFRMLRANLRYFNIDRQVRSVLITSAAPGDGKSTVAWNLAAAAAGAGAKVLLLESDLRHPSLAAAQQVKSTPGLSNVLSGTARLEDVTQKVEIPERTNGRSPHRTMDVVTAGPLPPNPTDLMDSKQMEDVIRAGEENYELVVIDTPPTSVVSDAIPLVTKVSGVIVVSRLGKSTREAIMHLRNQLRNLDAPTLGVVVNALGSRGGQYGYGYAYGGYGDLDAADRAPSGAADGGNGSGVLGRFGSSEPTPSVPAQATAVPAERVDPTPAFRPAPSRDREAGTQNGASS